MKLLFVFGPDGSGKTTIVEKLTEHLRHEEPYIVRFKHYEFKKSWNKYLTFVFIFILVTFSYARNIIEIGLGVLVGKRIIIVERHALDSIAKASYFNNIDVNKLINIIPVFGHTILLKCDHKERYKRDSDHSRDFHMGISNVYGNIKKNRRKDINVINTYENDADTASHKIVNLINE